MPHDHYGHALAVGDKVLIPGVIKNLFPTEEYCNCSVELEWSMPPDNKKEVFSSINTAQVVRVNDQVPMAEGEEIVEPPAEEA